MASQVTLYRFKDITVVPTATDLIDIVLSRTQRKTPTEVHKQFKISRIRNFYLRKIKFCQQTIHDKLVGITQQFPRLDEIHPFYADLCNVLYDRDHYKLALGQCNSIKNVVDNIARDYVRLMKYADSLYKCKMLKRAALGRMCTALKKLQASFKYLEEVRQHLSRLPSINPNSRTLIVCGYPNVGKSSFMNKVSNANVEVQPYAFTTKSLYVGHFDFAYSRFQVVDTPGVLDRPLEERNTIEMIAVTALAHIHCAVLYFLDISETCGFSLDAQLHLYRSIRPLFKNKPIILVVNKIDVVKFESLPEEQQNAIKDLAKDGDAHMVFSSTLTGDGVDAAKDKACSLLLEQRVAMKAESVRASGIMNRLYVTEVNPDFTKRPPCIPQSVILARQLKTAGAGSSNVKTEKELEEEMGGPGVYSTNLTKNYILSREEWKDDIVPEIWNGKNILDFVDPNIEEKLKMLEREEELLLGQEAGIDYHDEEWERSQNLLKQLHKKIGQQRVLNAMKKSRNRPRLHKKERCLSEVEEHLKQMGLDAEPVKKRAASKQPSLSRARGRSLERSSNGRRGSTVASACSSTTGTLKFSKASDLDDDDDDESDDDGPNSGSKLGRKASMRARKRLRSLGYHADELDDDDDEEEENSRGRSRSRTRSISMARRRRIDGSAVSIASSSSMKPNRIKKSIPKLSQKLKAEKLRRASDKKRNRKGMKGEADRFIGTAMPKHLFSGKRGIGKTDRR